jgi:ABC-type sugar transport system substrate-binding protein
MKIWQVITAILLLVSLPALSSCDLLGIGGKSKEQKYLEQQLDLMKQQQAAAQKAQEEYYQALQKGLEDYAKQLQEYQNAQMQQQIQAIQQAAEEKAKEEIPYN